MFIFVPAQKRRLEKELEKKNSAPPCKYCRPVPQRHDPYKIYGAPYYIYIILLFTLYLFNTTHENMYKMNCVNRVLQTEVNAVSFPTPSLPTLALFSFRHPPPLQVPLLRKQRV